MIKCKIIRLIDILLSVFLLFILVPIFLITIVMLLFTGENKIFFLQKRVGYKGVNFELLKFATMLKDSPFMGSGTITIKDDPRILPLGGVLRKTKINELPQLYNIFKGDMSFVGPRPLTEQNFSYYSVTAQNIIQNVRPGLTGIGSIVFRGEEELLSDEKQGSSLYRNVITPYKAQLEIWFAKNNSLWLYFVILILTFWVVIKPKSNIHWKVLVNLPEPPQDLINLLGYPVKC